MSGPGLEEIAIMIESRAVTCDTAARMIREFSESEVDRELLHAIKGLMDLIDTGQLVRGTKDDELQGWAMRQIPIVMALKAAQDVIAKAECR